MKNQECKSHAPEKFVLTVPTMDNSGSYAVTVNCCMACEPARYQSVSSTHSKVGKSYPVPQSIWELLDPKL